MKQIFSSSFVLLFAVSVLFFSCKKESKAENKPPKFPVTLVLKNITMNGDIRIYARDGEITDSFLKASAIKSTGVNDILYNFGPQHNPNYSVSFLSDNFFRVGLYEDYSYTKKDSSFFFRRDSSIGPFDYYASLIAPFILYPEMKSNNNGNYIHYKELIGKGSYSALNIDKLDICLLFKDSLTGNFISKYSRRNISNKFNTEGLKTLGKKDTVAVREFRLEYR